MWVESVKPNVVSSQENMNIMWNESQKLRDIEGYIEGGVGKEELDWSVSKVPGKLNTTICCCWVDDEKLSSFGL